MLQPGRLKFKYKHNQGNVGSRLDIMVPRDSATRRMSGNKVPEIRTCGSRRGQHNLGKCRLATQAVHVVKPWRPGIGGNATAC